MSSLSFEKKSGYVLCLAYSIFITAIVILFFNHVRLFGLVGLHYENLLLYTAPDIVALPWIFYSGINILSIGMGLLTVAFFFLSRYLIGYLWGKIFILLHKWYLQLLFVIVTITALLFYVNFVLFNAISIEQISQSVRSASTVEDCLKYFDSASGYMPICILAVAKKSNNPDLCFELEKIGWNRSSDNCLQDYVYAKEDPAVCAKMSDLGNNKNLCFSHFKQ